VHLPPQNLPLTFSPRTREPASQSVFASWSDRWPGKEKTASDSEELKYPSWQAPLRAALLEVDGEKLAKKIQKVEALISDGLQATASGTDHHDEREAIADAASIPGVLKKDKL
jgi:hypothetical protein